MQPNLSILGDGHAFSQWSCDFSCSYQDKRYKNYKVQIVLTLKLLHCLLKSQRFEYGMNYVPGLEHDQQPELRVLSHQPRQPKLLLRRWALKSQAKDVPECWIEIFPLFCTFPGNCKKRFFVLCVEMESATEQNNVAWASCIQSWKATFENCKERQLRPLFTKMEAPRTI